MSLINRATVSNKVCCRVQSTRARWRAASCGRERCSSRTGSSASSAPISERSGHALCYAVLQCYVLRGADALCAATGEKDTHSLQAGGGHQKRKHGHGEVPRDDILGPVVIVALLSLQVIPNAISIRTRQTEYMFRSFLRRDECHSLLTAMWKNFKDIEKSGGGGHHTGKPRARRPTRCLCYYNVCGRMSYSFSHALYRYLTHSQSTVPRSPPPPPW